MRQPDLHKDGWVLEDGEERFRLFPDTFEIPPVEVRSALQPGDFAKLIFCIAVDDESASEAIERMWVLVRERDGNDYRGLLDNKPDAITENPHFWLGDEIPFQPRHVIDVRKGDDASRLAAVAPPRNGWPR